MYCGDETGAIVGDIGSSSCKFGFAGEDLPKTTVTSVVGYDADTFENSNASKRYIGVNSIRHRHTDMEVKRPFQRGKVSDWDAMEAMWDYAVCNLLSTNMRRDPTAETQDILNTHPILVCSPTVDTVDARARQTELLFEKFTPPAVFLARNAMLSAFSTGRSNALIVDVGASGTVSAPVIQGHVLHRSVQTSAVGGDVIDSRMLRLLDELAGKPIRAPCTFRAQVNSNITDAEEPRTVQSISPDILSKIHPSYLEWDRLRVAQDAKHSVCYVIPTLNPKFGNTLKREDMYESDEYELPDGTILEFITERFQAVEVLIDPKIPPFGTLATSTNQDETAPILEPTADQIGVPQLIHQTLKSCDPDSRKELLQQIILVGGGSLVGGFAERCSAELSALLPSSHRARFQNPLPFERHFSSWIGGSVLASLGSFQQMWISRAEYDEYGTSIVERRCYQ